MRPALLLSLTLACAPVHTAAPPRELPTTPPVQPAPEAPGIQEVARLRLGAVGDIMMHGMVKRSARDAGRAGADHAGHAALFEHIAPALRPLDVVFGNLETPIAPVHGGPTPQMVFNASPTLLPALHEAGFSLLSFANNHVYDQGRGGFLETIEQLEVSPLQAAGAGRSCAEARAPVLVEAQGIQLALIATSDLYNQFLNAAPDQPCSFRLEVEQVAQSVQQARATGADLVLLSVHWGSEYKVEAAGRQRQLAGELVAAGVDVILGHHPHVAQPVEVQLGPDGQPAVVAYSLGNFISNQSAWYRPESHRLTAGNPRDGLLLRLDAVRYRDERGLEWVELADLRVEPLFTENNTVVGRAPDAPVRIRTWRSADRIEALSTSDPERAEQLLQRAQHLGEIVGRHWLADGPWDSPPPPLPR